MSKTFKPIKLIFFSLLLVGLSSCSVLKKNCDCPNFSSEQQLNQKQS